MPTTTIEFTVTKLDNGAVVENTTSANLKGAGSSEDFAMIISNTIYPELVSNLDSILTNATLTVSVTITT